MGYTNYWKPYKPEENEWVPKEFPKELQDDIRKLAKTAKAKGIEFESRVSSKTIQIKGPCEWLTLTYVKERERGSWHNQRFGIDCWTFTKTAREPYDAVVKGVLMLLQHYNVIERWSFDGDPLEKEYADAFHLMEEAGLVGKE